MLSYQSKYFKHVKVKVKVKFTPRTDHEGPKEE